MTQENRQDILLVHVYAADVYPSYTIHNIVNEYNMHSLLSMV